MTIQSKTKNITDANAEQIIAAHNIVLIDCWATWCGPCKEIGPIIDELAKKYAEQACIGKLNIDESSHFTEKHAIKSVPNLLFFKNGEKVDQLIGTQSIQALTKKLDELIAQ